MKLPPFVPTVPVVDELVVTPSPSDATVTLPVRLTLPPTALIAVEERTGSLAAAFICMVTVRESALLAAV